MLMLAAGREEVFFLRYYLWLSRSVHPLRKAIYKHVLHCLVRQGNCQIMLYGCLQLPVENCAK